MRHNPRAGKSTARRATPPKNYGEFILVSIDISSMPAGATGGQSGGLLVSVLRRGIAGSSREAPWVSFQETVTVGNQWPVVGPAVHSLTGPVTESMTRCGPVSSRQPGPIAGSG